MKNRTEIRGMLNLILAVVLLWGPSLRAQKWPVYARHGMVVSAQRLASAVGVEILQKGGNAIDAAVATGFALGVVHPSAGNIGGGGFMMIRLADGTCVGIDYREKAPKAAHEKMYLDENGELIGNLNHDGYLSVGVPGTVAGFALALEKFGTMSLREVLQPAIKLAAEGFPLSHGLAQSFYWYEEDMRSYPGSRKKFFKPDGSKYELGDIWRQPDLARTLQRIAQHGRDGFYKGETAEIFEREMRANGGLITREDLAAYEAKIREPIVNQYRDYTVYSMPPPSSGGVTLSIMLNILEGYDLNRMGHNSAQYLHHLAEAMRRAYEDRAQYLGDPDFYPEIPVEMLISQEYADRLRATIRADTVSLSNPAVFDWGAESGETTHFAVVDAQGNAVSNTYTLEYSYGSRIVLDGAGFLLNNEMGDFNPWPGHTDTTGLIGTPPNLIRPGKRMLSSMTPTIVAKDGRTFMLVGSPGGRTIINTVLQCILNVVDFDMNIYEAIDAPRVHHQWLPDELRMEKFAANADTIEKLRALGHRIAYRSSQGRAMGILIDPQTGLRSGAADPRSPDGAARGY